MRQLEVLTAGNILSADMPDHLHCYSSYNLGVAFNDGKKVHTLTALAHRGVG
jgi:hypothetical protein